MERTTLVPCFSAVDESGLKHNYVNCLLNADAWHCDCVYVSGPLAAYL